MKSWAFRPDYIEHQLAHSDSKIRSFCKSFIFPGEDFPHQFIHHSGVSKRHNNGNIFAELYAFPCGEISTSDSINRGTLMLFSAIIDLKKRNFPTEAHVYNLIKK